MTANAQSIAPFYKGWNDYQQHLLDVMASLTPEQLELSVAPKLRPVGMIATHIVGVRYGWMNFVLHECQDILAPMSTWDDVPMRSAEEIIEGLKITWRALEDILNRYTYDDLQTLVTDVDENDNEVTLTRQWVLWHLIEHDMHHGGELSYALGMHGVPGIDI